ncbi:MAG TPA: GntR family transcriptional regulator [Anaerolineales bacterium]|nr:GntR family transcriptional regulator [Anaerolineales bacterium]
MASLSGTRPSDFVLDPPVDRLIAGLPLYVQIAEALLGRIERGELVAGARLPPERELSESLGVNRLTLRRALRELEGRGLLRRSPGIGTFVAEPKIERQAGWLVSFTRGLQQRGLTPGTRLLSITTQPVDAPQARDLKLPVSEMVYVIQRLRTMNAEPVLLERYTLSQRRFAGLERFDLQGRSVFEVLESEFGARIARARQSLEPIVAGPQESELLGIAPGAPLMLERRLSFDPQDRPVELGRDVYRGDRFRFVTERAPREG